MSPPPERRGAGGPAPERRGTGGPAPERRGAGGPARHLAVGQRGEDLAAAWYEAHGYEVLARNWRCGDGELDVVARRGPVLVFCEVKARSTTRFGVPAEAVGPAKQRRLRRLAARWLAEGPTRAPQLRFDVASVLAGRLEVIEGAF